MPRYHQSVDHDTGEVYNVETTRQAKRRYQRNGAAQSKPTIGQLNAADIWNKQEEKIKRDRDREDKRRKNRLKQEAQETRQREIQQELLRKGKISIEQTWGKVNASQNRLHKFFDANRGSTREVAAGSEREWPGSDQAQNNEAAETTEAGHLQEPGTAIFEDLEQIFTTSPLSPASGPDCEKATSHMAATVNPAAKGMEFHPPHSTHTSHNTRRVQASQDLMPPPRRPALSPNATRQNYDTSSSGPSGVGVQAQPVNSMRSPLKEMTISQVKTRAKERTDPMEKRKPHDATFVATQVVRDTLSGLCSQDLDDDFTDDEKENDSSIVVEAEPKPEHSKPEETYGTGTTPELLGSPSVLDKRRSWDDFDDSGFDEFDDEGIDDESLLSLAASQRLKTELFVRPGGKRTTEASNANIESVFPAAGDGNQRVSFSFSSRLGDSFATDGINDDDLLRNLEDFECGTLYSRDDLMLPDTHDTSEVVDELPRKRRALPWVRNPIRYSFGSAGGDTDELTPSPQSQLADG